MTEKHLTAIFIGIILVATFLAYSSSFQNDFVWDDTHFIVNAPYVHSTEHVPELLTRNVGYSGGARNNFYRPVYSLLNMLNYVTGGGTPLAFHLTNTALHASCAIILFLLFTRISGNSFVSFSAALFFALHPTATQAVTYIAGRADALYVLFGCGALLLFFLNVSQRKTKIYILSLVCFSLALLSKELAIIIPFLLLICLYRCRGPFSNDPAAYKSSLLFFALLIIYFLLRKTVFDFSAIAHSGLALSPLPFALRLLTACKALFMYIRFLFMPVGFQMETHLPPSLSIADTAGLLSGAGVAVLLWGIFVMKEKQRDVFFGLSWFLVSLLPVLNIYPVNAYIAVHWLYLPSIGILFAFSSALWVLSKRFGVKHLVLFWGIVFLLSAGLGTLTYIKNSEWKNEEVLYKSILRYSQTPRVYVNLGNIYARRGDLDQAERYYLKALEIAPGQTEAYVNLAYVCTSRRQFAKSEQYLKKALELNPRHANAHFNLAAVYLNTGRMSLAETALNKTLQLNPNNTAALNALGQLYLRQGKREQAKELFTRSLSVTPDQPKIKSLLSKIK